MEKGHSQNLLVQHLERMADLESQIVETLEELSEPLDYAGEPTSLNELRSIAANQQKALRDRLRDLRGSNSGGSLIITTNKSGGVVREEAPLPAYEALQTLYGRLNEAAFGYAGLHLVAHRFFDSGGEGNTADLAEKHLKSYARAALSIVQLSSDALIEELGKHRQECQCQCPSCGLGLCLCSPHGSNTANDVLRDALRIVTEPGDRGIRVRAPRARSAADRAGLRAGDVILAVDGQDILNEGWDSIKMQQDTIRKHQSGEDVRLRVKRASGELVEVSVTRP